jgi:hypothetical protein
MQVDPIQGIQTDLISKTANQGLYYASGKWMQVSVFEKIIRKIFGCFGMQSTAAKCSELTTQEFTKLAQPKSEPSETLKTFIKGSPLEAEFDARIQVVVNKREFVQKLDAAAEPYTLLTNLVTGERNRANGHQGKVQSLEAEVSTLKEVARATEAQTQAQAAKDKEFMAWMIQHYTAHMKRSDRPTIEILRNLKDKEDAAKAAAIQDGSKLPTPPSSTPPSPVRTPNSPAKA